MLFLIFPDISLFIPAALSYGKKRILLHAETCDGKQIAKGKYKQKNITLWDILSLPTSNGQC
ncbi:hypothetical protein CTM61_03730 [Prevotella intermedia]|nr:hypothetical protein CTM61_03730 [Prevotella intermedia]